MSLEVEFLHGFKLGFYLDPDSRLRREMWRLAHAHGTLLALVQIGFAAGLLHFIPYLGPLVFAVASGLAGFMQFGTAVGAFADYSRRKRGTLLFALLARRVGAALRMTVLRCAAGRAGLES